MIPKIFHQTYKSKDNLPSIYKECQTETLKHFAESSGWTYRFWTDEMMDAEIRENFSEYYGAFSSLPRMIMKVDMFRYCLMWKYGGLYADLDYMFIKPFDMLDSKLVLPISRRQSKEKYPIRFGNCVFASEPGHPFWKLLLDDLLENKDRLRILADDEVDMGENGTGPGFVTRMFHTVSDYIRSTISTPGRFIFHPPSGYRADQLNKCGAYGIHRCVGLWRTNNN